MTSRRRRGVGSKVKREPSRSQRHAYWIVTLSLIAVFASYFSRTRVSNEESNFKVVDLPGKGKGLVAARDIKQGELIIREKPLFITPLQTSSSPSQLIWNLFQTLSQSDREAFMNLSYVHLPTGVDPLKHPEEVALAIFHTNSVSTGDGNAGIFPRMARLNHGCAGSFNSVYSWREEEGALVVHALKSISKGQELLTTYLNTKQPRAQRRAYLADHYGFECQCSVCTLPDDLLRESDDRLSRMESLYTHFSTWGTGAISGGEAIRTAREIWKLGEEEGYWSERGRLAGDVVWVAAAQSDYSAVVKWAEEAIKWYGSELGEDSRQVSSMRSTAADPKRHAAWGTRSK